MGYKRIRLSTHPLLAQFTNFSTDDDNTAMADVYSGSSYNVLAYAEEQEETVAVHTKSEKVNLRYFLRFISLNIYRIVFGTYCFIVILLCDVVIRMKLLFYFTQSCK
mmetsp:Transcript_10614/g.16087  ORF Transcript_10614/g.16087 Transcript_10614/m.16087 type:complete len:107 (+) Transcript_10614:595-915(+)